MKHFLILLVLIASMSCNKSKTKPMTSSEPTTISNLPEWAKSANIYEVNIRQYTPQGTINAFSDHIPRLKAMGVDILWLMPVFPISEAKRKGSLGSYYAVSDFREVNPKFGTKQDLINLIDKIHAYKMKVILDWVPNHTGWDHHWLKEHPEFYTKNSAGEITDPLDAQGKSMGWTDVADLNYDNAEMRKAMIADMLYWVKDHYIDGYRMDIAWGVPLDFWKECSQQLKAAKPDIFMLAEAEEADQMSAKVFNVCYAWTLHHMMNDIANNKKNARSIDQWRAEHLPKFKDGLFMHFITNHDENSWQGTELERMGEAYKSFAILTQTFDGVPLLYSGQEEPLQKRLEFFEKDDIGFKEYRNANFYEKLLKLKHDHPALWNGSYGGSFKKLVDHDHVYAYLREKDGDRVLVILNLSNQKQTFQLKEDFTNMIDYLEGTDINLTANTVLTLLPWEYTIGVNKAK